MISDWEWALRYTGDVGSFYTRSEALWGFLVENGMTPQSQVLDIGCGCLAPGAALIEYLAPGHYTGIEPFGLLVNVAMRQFPQLEHKSPRFLDRTDFDASEAGRKFDFVVAHSVLSHCAHWQLDELLTNVRKVVDEGAVFLCSFRNDQYGSWSEEWRYPAHTTFRLPTIIAAGVQIGWRVEIVPEYKARLTEVAPNDLHDWLRLTAVPSAATLNEQRLAEEERAREEREALRLAEEARIAALEAEDAETTARVGLSR